MNWLPTDGLKDYRPRYRWDIITKQARFADRDGAGALTFRGKMWLLGGWNPWNKVYFPRICNSEVWSSVNGTQWTLESAQAPWGGRHTGGYAVFKDRMWIIGGDTSQGLYQSDVWKSEDGVHWDLVRDNVPWAPRVLHYTVVFQDRIWVMGGQTVPRSCPADELFYGDVWNSADGINWDRVTDAAPWGPRGMIGGSAVLNGRIWILGGGTFDTPGRPLRDYHNDAWSSANGIDWTLHTAHAPWEPRQYHDVAVFDDRLWVLEGYLDGYNLNDTWYSEDGEHWTEVRFTPWAARHAASVFVHDGGLWLVAGNNMTSDVWKLVRAEE